MVIENALSPNTSNESLDDEEEDDAYIPSPRAPHHGKGKGMTSGSRVEIEEEEESEHNDEERDDGDREDGNKILMLKTFSLSHMLTWDLWCSRCFKTLDGGTRSAIRASQRP
jgi:hypothetical protein